jgi:hypothetical protein
LKILKKGKDLVVFGICNPNLAVSQPLKHHEMGFDAFSPANAGS